MITAIILGIFGCSLGCYMFSDVLRKWIAHKEFELFDLFLISLSIYLFISGINIL